MTIIRVKNFDELKAMNTSDMVNKLYEDGELTLSGGLDHVEQTKNQIKIFDIGNNGKGHSCIIRRAK